MTRNIRYIAALTGCYIVYMTLILGISVGLAYSLLGITYLIIGDIYDADLINWLLISVAGISFVLMYAATRRNARIFITTRLSNWLIWKQ